MSFRPSFFPANNIFSPKNPNNVSTHRNIAPPNNIGEFQRSIQNFPDSRIISSNINRYPLPASTTLGTITNVNNYNNSPLPRTPINAPSLFHPNLINFRPPNVPENFASNSSNLNPPFHGQLFNRNAISSSGTVSSNIANFNFEPKDIAVQRFPSPMSNATSNSLPPNINFSKLQNGPYFNSSVNVPVSLPSLSRFPVSTNQNTRNTLTSSTNFAVENMNSLVPPPVTFTSSLTVRPYISLSQGSMGDLQNNSVTQIPLQLTSNDTFKTQNLRIPTNSLTEDKEIKIDAFLAKFPVEKIQNKHTVAIPEFRYVIKAVMCMIKILNERKIKLSKMVNASESEWKSVIEDTLNKKEELSTLCSLISAPDHLNNIVGKLTLIKKKRERKKKTKQYKLAEKLRDDQKRMERHQEIDKWLDDIKEKNQKMKREAELKKEADYILLEVRKKIYEARKTIEKIKVFERLRSARQANATQKGLHVLTMHNVKFEKKMTVLKETMMKQLADYEAEEKALKVMLETEQEGQREEEAQWKIKKMKTLQQRRQKHIMECLFGISDDPEPTDPLYFFHKFHTSGTSSIENLVQIRRQWDRHIAEDGDVIPQHWVVPVAPCYPSWERCLVTSNN